MERKRGSEKKDKFSDALLGKNIPVLTLDNKWYRLLDEIDRTSSKELEDKLNALLKRQGKINTETKDIKKLKKKLMNEIVPMAGDAENRRNSLVEKQIDEHKRLIAECNQRLENYQDELLDLPRDIEKLNYELMMLTMECCYDTMQQNTEEIQEISDWVTEIRIELKKRLIHKQEMEQKNHDIYSYMHDIFGADVVNLFDMKYNPEEQHPKVPKQSNE